MPASKLPAVRQHKIGLHYLPAASAGGAYIAASGLDRHHALLGAVDASARSALYISLTTTAGALFGFAIVGITVLLTVGGGRRIDWLYKQDEFAYVRKIFLGAIHSVAIATVYFSILIVVDTHQYGNRPLESIGAALVVLVIFRLWAMIRLLGDLLDVAIADRTESGTQLNPPFTEPLDDPA